jgi:hypothetical protein
MGLCLFPDDGDINSPDISWSYHGFGEFRRRLAEAEGIVLSEGVLRGDARFGIAGSGVIGTFVLTGASGSVGLVG